MGFYLRFKCTDLYGLWIEAHERMDTSMMARETGKEKFLTANAAPGSEAGTQVARQPHPSVNSVGRAVPLLESPRKGYCHDGGGLVAATFDVFPRRDGHSRSRGRRSATVRYPYPGNHVPRQDSVNKLTRRHTLLLHGLIRTLLVLDLLCRSLEIHCSAGV